VALAGTGIFEAAPEGLCELKSRRCIAGRLESAPRALADRLVVLKRRVGVSCHCDFLAVHVAAQHGSASVVPNGFTGTNCILISFCVAVASSLRVEPWSSAHDCSVYCDEGLSELRRVT